MGIIKNYHDKKWTLQFLDALYNSMDNDYQVTEKYYYYVTDNHITVHW
jgi:hypothetical protein